jgi:hypothetical protein
MQNPTLESLLVAWATEADLPSLASEWMDELASKRILNLHSLVIIAESSRWLNFVDDCSLLLGARMEKWFSDEFPQRKLFFFW